MSVHTSSGVTSKTSAAVRTVLAAAFMLVGGDAAARADTPQFAYNLPALVVTATRIETPVAQTASSVTVIAGEEIEERQQRTVVDVLRTVPGLNVVQSGGLGGATSVFIRGTNANHALVLIDGLRANDPSTGNAAFNFAHLLTENIDRIEIVRGPLSTLYGSDALGGVINIITRKGEGPPSATAAAEIGSFNTYLQTVGVQGTAGRFDYNIGLWHLDTHSVSATPPRRRMGRDEESDPYRNTTLSSRLGLDVTENFNVSLFTRLIATGKDLDFRPEDPNSRERTEQSYNRLVGTLDLFDGAWTQTFGAGYVQIDRRDTDAADAYSTAASSTRNEGRRTKLDWQSDFRVIDNTVLTFGLESEEEHFEFEDGASGTSASARTNGLYAQANVTAWDRVFVTLGARVDDHDRFGAHDTYRLAAAYLHRETGTKLKGSIASGFKAPSLFQLFANSPFFTGNPDLEPEESIGWEIGFEQELAEGRVAFGTTYFRNDIENLILADPTFTTNINVGEATTSGLESFLELRPVATLALRIDHTFLHAEDGDGTQLARRPAHKLSITADYAATPEWSVGLGAVYDGERADFDADTFGRVYPGGYTLVRFTSRYAINESWTLFGRVENALDRRYEEPDGFNQPGIGVFAGVRARF